MMRFMKKRFVLIVAFGFLCHSCNGDDESKGLCVEESKENCVVTFELNPVCGCNGITYENPSTAECNGIDDYMMGACN